ncbi:hypothetical protein NliqN6_2985 [Naganishia liquefaciens]|uniref:methionyl-tRNA formyltransferase n=1 Tax=Naganishia liquefaciens TaxID=104408 RepID=A0A8H3TTH0_9TREE|nr:hypothetical protein NliqN6_2985 [Naganishia liquefaciens]
MMSQHSRSPVSSCRSRQQRGRPSCIGSPDMAPSLLNILFLGSDLFSVGTLQPLLRAESLWSSLRVVTAGEKDVGRGGKTRRRMAPPLHEFALNNGLEVFVTPERIKDWQPPEPFPEPHAHNVLVTASFGHILPTELLQSHFPRPETRLNVHPSRLPQYRGAAPIQWAIARRDTVTGVSVQSLAMGGGKMVDKGELWAVKEEIPIHERDTYTTLLPRLASIGGDLLVDTLRTIAEGNAVSTPQHTPVDAAGCPVKLHRAPKITHETVHIDFARQTAQEIDALFRGMSHQHALWTTFDGVDLRLLDIRPARDAISEDVPPGTAIFQKRFAGSGEARLAVRCEDGTWIDVRRVQQAGKREVGVADWWNGVKRKEDGRVLFGR